MNITKTNCAIQLIEIYLMDSTISTFMKNWGLNFDFWSVA